MMKSLETKRETQESRPPPCSYTSLTFTHTHITRCSLSILTLSKCRNQVHGVRIHAYDFEFLNLFYYIMIECAKVCQFMINAMVIKAAFLLI